MFVKILIFSLVVFLLEIQAVSLDRLSNNLVKDSSEEKTGSKDSLESVKLFVQLVESLKLNVTIVGSYAKENKNYVEETLSLSMHLPRNQDGVTRDTLDDAKQEKFLKKTETLSDKEHVGARTRVVQIDSSGSERVVADNFVNPQYYIKALGVERLNPVAYETQQIINDTYIYLRNYIINEPAGPDFVQNAQVILGNVKISNLEITPDFPKEMQKVIEVVLPTFWMALDDYDVVAKVLGSHLDKRFKENVQVMIGNGRRSTFATGAKTFAHYSVGDNSNILVFVM